VRAHGECGTENQVGSSSSCGSAEGWSFPTALVCSMRHYVSSPQPSLNLRRCRSAAIQNCRRRPNANFRDRLSLPISSRRRVCCTRIGAYTAIYNDRRIRLFLYQRNNMESRGPWEPDFGKWSLSVFVNDLQTRYISGTATMDWLSRGEYTGTRMGIAGKFHLTGSRRRVAPQELEDSDTLAQAALHHLGLAPFGDDERSWREEVELLVEVLDGLKISPWRDGIVQRRDLGLPASGDRLPRCRAAVFLCCL